MKAFEVTFFILTIFMFWLQKREQQRFRLKSDLRLYLLFLFILFATFMPSFEGILLTSFRGLDLRDLTFLSLWGLLVFDFTKGRKPIITSSTLPLIIFYIITCIATILGRFFFQHIRLHNAFTVSRPLIFMSLAILVPSLIRTRRRLNCFVQVLLSYSMISMLLIVLQTYGLGQRIELVPGSALWSKSVHAGGRSVSFALLFVSLFCVIRKIPLRKSMVLPWIMLLAALLLSTINTGARARWAGLIGAISLLFLLLPLRMKFSFLGKFGFACVFLLLCALVVAAVIPDVADRLQGLTSRVTSIFKSETYQNPLETGVRTASGARQMERTFAMRVVRKYPIIGTGLGYSHWWDYGHDRQRISHYYMHNSYIWILMNTGILGLLAFLGFYVQAVVRGLRGYLRVWPRSNQAVVFGFSGFLLMLMIASWAQPNFFSISQAAGIGVLIGTNEAIFRVSRSFHISQGKPI